VDIIYFRFGIIDDNFTMKLNWILI